MNFEQYRPALEAAGFTVGMEGDERSGMWWAVNGDLAAAYYFDEEDRWGSRSEAAFRSAVLKIRPGAYAQPRGNEVWIYSYATCLEGFPGPLYVSADSYVMAWLEALKALHDDKKAYDAWAQESKDQ